MTGGGVNLEGLTKIYRSPSGGGVAAVNGFSLEMAPGEMTALLGPSGCGKTTVLRMIAGLETPTSGRVTIAGRDVTSLPPERRNVGMVFQSYALFPHMTVRDNVGYGLKLAGLRGPELASRVDAALDRMRISAEADRLPAQLSGGQQQRTAVARAVATEPSVLLFDEPLSNLDANLREYLRDELRKIQQDTGIAALYVTHDNAEAMAIADRLVVMRSGVVEQAGSAREVYERPASRFVAAFMGQAGFARARIISRDGGRVRVGVLGAEVVLGTDAGVFDDGAVCMIRPEAVRLDAEGEVRGVVSRAVYMGQAMRYDVAVGGEEVRVFDSRYAANGVLAVGDPVQLSLRTEMLRLLS